MDKNTALVLIAGLLVSGLLFLLSVYLAGIALILTVALVMSLMIMQDSYFHPDIVASMRDDAKAIVFRNSGNAAAVNIHVTLVPVNREFSLPSLAADETHEYILDSMAEDLKVVITFENEQNVAFSRSYPLSALGQEFEPLKPMVPIFSWK